MSPSRLLAVLIAFWSLSAATSAGAQQYKPEFKNSIVVGPTGPWGEAASKFADLLKERSQGRINVKNYFSGQLFTSGLTARPVAKKQTTEFELLREGVADFALGSIINWSAAGQGVESVRDAVHVSLLPRFGCRPARPARE